MMLDKTINEHLNKTLNTGRVLGLKEANDALKSFLDEKEKLGHPSVITRKELGVFMTTYIGQAESKLDLK